MSRPTIYADFNNTDPAGRLRLNCRGTFDDLRSLSLELAEGMVLTFSDGELAVEGTVVFSPDERIWVAAIDWELVSDVPPDA